MKNSPSFFAAQLDPNERSLASQTRDALEDTIARIDLTRMPFLCELRLDNKIRHLEYHVVFVMHVRCVETGKPIKVFTMQSFDVGAPEIAREHAEYLILRLIRRGIEHEIDECLFVDGKRLHDPHEQERRLARSSET